MPAQIVIVPDLQSGTVDGSPVPFDPLKPTVKVKAVMSDETARDPANSLTLRLMTSYDGGRSFFADGNVATWAGDPADDGRNPGHPAFPSVTATFSQVQPTHVTAQLSIGQGLVVSAGASVDLS